MSLASTYTIGTVTFERRTEGQYIDSASTLDTPSLLQIANRNLVTPQGLPISNGQPAQITITRLVTKNSGVPGAGDYVAKCWQSMQWVPGQFSQTEISAIATEHHAFRIYSDVMTRLFRAEL